MFIIGGLIFLIVYRLFNWYQLATDKMSVELTFQNRKLHLNSTSGIGCLNIRIFIGNIRISYACHFVGATFKWVSDINHSTSWIWMTSRQLGASAIRSRGTLTYEEHVLQLSQLCRISCAWREGVVEKVDMNLATEKVRADV